MPSTEPKGNLIMKRIITSLLAAALLATTLPASATSYNGYARGWWVETNGDITFSFLNVDNTVYVTGMCGSGSYRLKVANANFDEVYSSTVLAAKNSYKMFMEVVACEGTVNLIKMVKVCTWATECN